MRERARKLRKAFAAVISSAFVVVTAGAQTFSLAFAEELSVYDQTSIEEDLAGIDLSGYQKDEEGAHRLIDNAGFMEFGYSNDNTVAGEYYGIYFYVYNPSEREVSERAGANVVNMAVEYDSEGQPVSYENVSLTLLDKTENNRFYKFRLTNAQPTYRREKEYAATHEGERRYDVAGIQLWFKGDQNATDSDNKRDGVVERTFFCSGFAKGFGSSDSEELKIREKTLTVIELDVRQTYWRSNYLNQNGEGHVNQITSVYFSIPESKITEYGDLYGVKCSWNEKRTTPVIVTNKSDFYELFSKWLGTKEGITDKFGVFDTFGGKFPATGMASSEWGWGYRYTSLNGRPEAIGGVVAIHEDTPVGWAFLTEEPNVLNAKISSDRMLQFAREKGNAEFLYTDDVDEGREYGTQTHEFFADEPMDMMSFKSEGSKFEKFLLSWQAFWSFGRNSYDWGDENTTVDPIKRVNDEDLSSGEELYVNDLDYDDFSAYYETNTKEGNAVFLLRFAVTDYYSMPATVIYDGDWRWLSDTDSTYMARETVFLDFDVISLTFNREGETTVLPVVSDPIDIISGIDPPAILRNWQDLFWILIGIGAACIAGIAVSGMIKRKTGGKR